MKSLPNDSDGLALQQIANRGIDMDKPIGFEFYVHADSEIIAIDVMDALKKEGVGDAVEIVFDEGELDEGEAMTEENEEFWPSWSVYIFRTMVPNYVDVVEMQDVLDRFSRPHGGLIDGWGVYQG